MAGLLTLADEVILLILDGICFVDIESFTLCCQKLYSIGNEKLQKHRERKHKYTVLECGGVQFPEPLDMLRGLLEDDELAPYPKKLIVEDCFFPYQTYYSTYQHFPDSEEDRKAWEGPRTEFLDLWDLIKAQMDQCQYITCQDNCEYAYYLRDIIGSVSWYTRNDPSDHHPLSKLSEVELEYSMEEYGFLQTFTLLPSVRILKGKCLNGSGMQRDMYWWGEDRNFRSQIATISIEQSIITPIWCDTLPEMLDLRTFTYNYNTRDFTITEWDYWRPGDLTISLYNTASHSLVSLDMTETVDSKTDRTSTRREPEHGWFMKCLVDFKVLADIRVSHDLFINDDWEDSKPCQHPNDDVTAAIDSWTISQKPKPRDRFSRLVDVLPASVEVLTLVKQYHVPDDLGRMFEGLAEVKSVKYPKFRKVNLEGGLQLSDESVEECSKAGVAVVYI